MALIAKIIGEASIRLRADSKTLGAEIRRIVTTALKQGTTGLRVPEGVTKPIGDDAEKTGRRVQTTFRKIISNARDVASGVLSAAASGTRIALIGVAAVGALSGIISLTSGVVGLAGAVAQGAGVIGLLPAVLTAVKAVSATLKLALEGVGESLSALASGDAQAFQESLKKLAPQARAFVVEIAKIKPEFDKIKKSLQETTFEGLSKSVQPLANLYLPRINQFFQAIGQSANVAARSVIDFANNGKTAGEVQQLLENIATAFSRLTPAIKPALSAFLDLTRVGSTFLPGMAQSISGIAERFAAFIRTAAESGALRDFFQRAIDTINQLGRIIADVAVGIRNIFRIGNQEAGGFLNNIEQATQRFRDFTESIGGSAALRDLFGIIRTLARALDDVMSALSPLLTPLREVVRLLADGLADALRQIAPKLAEFGGVLLQQLKDILPDLIPFVAKLAGGILDILTAVAPLLRPLAKLLEALTPLIDPLVRLAEAVMPSVIRTIETLTTVVGDMADVLGKIIDFIAKVIEGFDKLSSAAGPVGPALSGLLTPVLGQLGKLTKSFEPGEIEKLFGEGPKRAGRLAGQSFVSGLQAIDPELQAALQKIFTAILSFFGIRKDEPSAVGKATGQAYARGISEAQEEAIAAAQKLIAGMFGIFNGVGKAGALSSGSQTGRSYAEGVSQQEQTAVAAAGKLVQALFGTWGPTPGQANNQGGQVGRGFAGGISGSEGAVRGAAGELAGAVRGPVESVSLSGAGRAIAQSLINGMNAMRQAVAAAAAFLGTTITQNKGPESVDRVLLFSAGQLIVQGLINGMNSKRTLLAKTLQDVTDQISSVTTSALDPGTVNIGNIVPASSVGGIAGLGGAGTLVLQQTNTMLPGADVNQFAAEVWRRGASDLASGNSVLNVGQQSVQTGLPAPGSTVNLGA